LIDLYFIQLLEPHRLFVKEGSLKKVCRSSVKQRHFFLFNDILIYASIMVSGTRFLLQQIFSNNKLRLEDVSNPEKFAFQIISPQRSFEVHAHSKQEKIDWMTTLIKTIETWKQQQSTFGIKEDENFQGAPVWMQDKKASTCLICQESFGVMKRRHHCRKCGSVICANCSGNQMSLPQLGMADRVRICDKCYKEENNLPRSSIRGSSDNVSNKRGTMSYPKPIMKKNNNEEIELPRD